jgi:hypothetical protein
MTICVSYERSIDKLRLPRCGTFGVSVTSESECNTVWDLRQRENWMDALKMAQHQIESDLGAPLCAQEICNERVRPRCDVGLKFKPIAYLGQKVYGDWTTADIVYSGTYPDIIGTAEICDVDYDLINEDNLDFTYPEIDCYEGQLPLQTPCIKRVTCEDLTPGLQFIWPACQLLVPDVETATLNANLPTTPDDNFLTEIRYRTWEVDEDLAYTLAGECTCGSCTVTDPTYTLSIGDANLGKICIEPASERCLYGNRHIYVNYGTSYNCGLTLDLNLEWAVILLALTKVGRPQLLCGCGEFDEIRKYWLELDELARQPLVVPWKLNYGSTRAGMEVARIVGNELRRMHFAASSSSGGAITTFSGNRNFRNKALVSSW